MSQDNESSGASEPPASEPVASEPATPTPPEQPNQPEAPTMPDAAPPQSTPPSHPADPQADQPDAAPPQSTPPPEPADPQADQPDPSWAPPTAASDLPPELPSSDTPPPAAPESSPAQALPPPDTPPPSEAAPPPGASPQSPQSTPPPGTLPPPRTQPPGQVVPPSPADEPPAPGSGFGPPPAAPSPYAAPPATPSPSGFEPPSTAPSSPSPTPPPGLSPPPASAPAPGSVPPSGFGNTPPQPPGYAPAPAAFGTPPPGPPTSTPPPAQQTGGGGGKRTGLIVGAAVGVVALGGLGLIALGGGDDTIETADSTTTSTALVADTTVETTTPATTVEVGPRDAEDLAHSVVQIQLLLEGEPTCSGSGTIVDPEGTVVTNFHVVEQSPFCPHDQIGIAIAESSQVAPTLVYEADLMAFDSELDIAVVRIARTLGGDAVSELFEPVEIGDSDAVSLGEQIRVIGYPGIGGDTVTFTTGSVSGFTDTPQGSERNWMKTDATITGGNSGGLAADSEGRFIGIPTRVGSGDGQIVDCRVITDSNGDGDLDGDDSCVPIGGFINGIRPVALAIPLIEEARTADPIDQGPPDRDEPLARELPEASNRTWTTGVTDEGFAIDDLVAVTSGLGELCITWDYENVPSGQLTDVVWLIDGETVPEASVLDAVNEGDTFGSFYACITNDAGLASGVYELAWVIEEELVFAEAIIVGDGSTATIDVENVTDVPICVVQFNPTGTATYGLNELAEPIEPGGVVVLDVAIGPLDARVIDCDGSIRIEDPSGFLVDEDLILTVD